MQERRDKMLAGNAGPQRDDDGVLRLAQSLERAEVERNNPTFKTIRGLKERGAKWSAMTEEDIRKAVVLRMESRSLPREDALVLMHLCLLDDEARKRFAMSILSGLPDERFQLHNAFELDHLSAGERERVAAAVMAMNYPLFPPHQDPQVLERLTGELVNVPTGAGASSRGGRPHPAAEFFRRPEWMQVGGHAPEGGDYPLAITQTDQGCYTAEAQPLIDDMQRLVDGLRLAQQQQQQQQWGDGGYQRAGRGRRGGRGRYPRDGGSGGQGGYRGPDQWGDGGGGGRGGYRGYPQGGSDDAGGPPQPPQQQAHAPPSSASAAPKPQGRGSNFQ